MKNLLEFKNLVKELRLKKGLTQRQLAKLVGVSDMYIYAIEHPEKPQIPSDDIIRKLARALASNAEEESEILKKLLTYRTLIKIPPEARDLLLQMDKVEKYISDESMPAAFVERLKKDIQNVKLNDIIKKTGIEEKSLNAILNYRRILSRKEVISLAQALGQSVYEYLLLANYVPDNIKKLLENNKIELLLRNLEDLSDENLDELMDGIINIIQAYKKKTSEHDRRKHKSSGKRFPEKE